MSGISLTSKKPRLNFWQIWNMSFGFLGIQFGFALQNANTSRIFETLGADTKNLAFYWLAAPVTGLIVQPIIGYYSDKTWHPKWGRRRPYFAIGAILASTVLIIMPNSATLWLAIGRLWLMDGSINISMEPFRAFVGDMLPDEQRTRGFAMQSFFIGIGAIVASILPWFMVEVMGIPDTDPEGGIPPNVKYAFYIGAFAFFTAVMWTVFSTKEYPPADEELSPDKPEKQEPLVIRYKPNTYLQIGLGLLVVGTLLGLWFGYAKLDPQLFVLCGIFGLFGIAYTIAALWMKKGVYRKGFVQMVRDFQNMPRTMIELAFVQFFSWFALFSMWIYTTSGITSHIYDMKLSPTDVQLMTESVERIDVNTISLLEKNGSSLNNDAEGSVRDKLMIQYNEAKSELRDYQQKFNEGATKAVASVKLLKFFLDINIRDRVPGEIVEKANYIQQEYNQGANWVGVLFGAYNGVAALAALILPWLASVTSRKVTHMIMLTLGGLGLISFYFIRNPDFLAGSMVGVGFAWASILAVPYAMLSASLPAKKMGYYMGIFNFFIVIPQIVAAALLGFLITTFFDGQFIYALVVGGCSMILAGLLSLMVHDTSQVSVKHEDHLDT
jgi:maltose/moltooligosaccharide transporter